MNNRQHTLLKEASKQTSYLPLSHYASVLGCSAKSVSHDIKVINATLDAAGLCSRIETKQGSGVRFVAAEGESGKIMGHLLLDSGDSQAYFERFYRGLLYLATAAESQRTEQDLAAHVFTSKAQIRLEIAAWKDLCSLIGISLIRRQSHYSLEGAECSIRTALLYYFYIAHPMYQQRVIETSISQRVWNLAGRFLSGAENEGGSAYTPNARGAAAFYLFIAEQRILQNRCLDELDEPFAIPQGTLESARATIRQIAGDRLTERQVHAEAVLLASSSALSAMKTHLSLHGFADPASISFAQTLRDSLERRYGLPLPVETAQALEGLAFQALQRARLGFPIALLDATPMKRFRLDWFIELEELISQSAGCAEMSMYGDDLARIAMLLCSYRDASRNATKHALLVSNSSFEQARYTIDRIEGLLPFVRIDRVISRTEASDEADGGESFLIAFEPVISQLPVCIISHAVTNDDIAKVARLALDAKTAYQGKPFESSRRTLVQKTLQEAVTAIYWDLTGDGSIKDDPDSFAEQFLNHCTVSNEFASTVIVPSQNGITGARIYDMPNLHIIRPVPTVAVLTVSPKDRGSLPEIIAEFNRLIDPLTGEQRSHGLPCRVTAGRFRR